MASAHTAGRATSGKRLLQGRGEQLDRRCLRARQQTLLQRQRAPQTAELRSMSSCVVPCASSTMATTSRYCCRAPHTRHCRSSRAPPATLLAASLEVVSCVVLCLPGGVLDAAQGRGATALNPCKGKRGNGDGRYREPRRRGISLTEEAET
ncbi:hypothetical protein BDA96_01G249200 [Sorghum bicolor]|jgi:hypothetical protein|uniref:Uncharacterized protein n=1 Tax=Sorghum bicolor TaxID=4558 RepID=A0A921S0G2_SORBI|nr:hypothetical protein BDA96_01G249200 [Sorghum bicolor]